MNYAFFETDGGDDVSNGPENLILIVTEILTDVCAFDSCPGRGHSLQPAGPNRDDPDGDDDDVYGGSYAHQHQNCGEY